MSRLKWSYLNATQGLSPVLHKLKHATSISRRETPFLTPSPQKSSRSLQLPTQYSPGILSEEERKLTLIDEKKDIKKEIERLQQHVRSNSTASRKVKNRALKKILRPATPYTNFDGQKMPTDLAVLTLSRKQVIAEIRKQSIPGLELIHLKQRQEALRPLEAVNPRQAASLRTRKDMRSRSQFATSIYGLAALPLRSRRALQEALVEVMPEGSRFTDDKLFK